MELISKRKLRDLMLINNLGVNALARATKLNPAVISGLLKRDSTVRLPTLAKLIQALSCCADDLLLEE